MTSIFGFKARFVPRIEDLSKRQTIRAERKRMPRVGEDLRLQHGSRFKPVLLGWATAIVVEPIQIDIKAGRILLGHDAETRTGSELLDVFARMDGFDDWPDMAAFWRAEHPSAPVFTGFRTIWGDTFRPGPRDP